MGFGTSWRGENPPNDPLIEANISRRRDGNTNCGEKKFFPDFEHTSLSEISYHLTGKPKDSRPAPLGNVREGKSVRDLHIPPPGHENGPACKVNWCGKINA